jgi:hypothetical protein
MFSSLVERSYLGLSHVDDTMCVHSVSGEWQYAVSDTNAQAPLTHMDKYSAKVAGDAIAARAKENAHERSYGDSLQQQHNSLHTPHRSIHRWHQWG